MATWKTVDEHEADGYKDETATVTVQNRANRLRAIFDGPVNLETTITFNEVDIERHTIEFYLNPRRRECSRVHTGSVEKNTDEFAAFFEELVEEHTR